jgi:predicted nucleotide-binding protein
MAKQTVFIGSSTAGVLVAEALQLNLSSFLDVHLWNQGIFGLSESTIETLEHAGTTFDFAILVFTPDDPLQSGGLQWFAPRDNVVLEFGFFLGQIGRRRTFIVRDSDPKLKLPSDIKGVTTANYTVPAGGLRPADLGPACTLIKMAIEAELEFNKKQEEIRMLSQVSESKIRREKAEQLIEDGLQVVCQALTRSYWPKQAKLRAFIFDKIGNDLVCSVFWTPYAVVEKKGLRFGINPSAEKQAAVVKAAILRKVCAERIIFSQEELDDVEGEIEKDLRFVLAAPILSPSGEVLGTVDFDASSEIGEEILSHEITHNVIFELGRLLHLAY